MKRLIILSVIVILVLSGCVVTKNDDDYFTLNIINEAKKRILEEYPEEELHFYEFTGGIAPESSPESNIGEHQKDGGAKDIDDLAWWQFVFGCGDNLSKTAIITKIDGEWQQPEIYTEIWGDDVIFDTEYIRVDLEDAIKILNVYIWQNTPCDVFDYVVFRHILNAEVTEPYYIFTIAPNQYVNVGAITGAILPDVKKQ
ncbi:MAG: hypothetical protein PWQ77_2050 [Kosmotogales bacterium]|nr:hypothetical protein [Kosmotogales bacterium]